MFVWCFAFFFLVCFSFSFLWQAKPNIVSNLVIPCGPFGGTIYYLTEKYRMSPKKGAMVKTSSSLNLQDDFPLVFRIDISINVENHPGQKKKQKCRNATQTPYVRAVFSPFWGGEPRASPWWPPGFSHGRRNALLLFGPMGSGKRSLAEAAAAEAGAQAQSGPGTSGHLVLVIGEIDLCFCFYNEI